MILVRFPYYWICLLLIAGCTVGPNYEKPTFDLPHAWHNKLAGEDASTNELKWWENFNDPILTSLIETGIENNLDLKMAESKILQSRTALKLSTANLYPNITANAASTHDAVSADTAITTSSGKRKRFYELYSTELDASWELDFFGRLRRSKESSSASLEASIADADGIFLTMVAEIAQNYIILRSNQQQLLIAEKIHQDWTKTYQLNMDLFKAGLGDAIAITQAKASQDQAFAALQPLKANIKAAIHRLGILMGQEPNLLYPILEKPMPIPMVKSTIFAGLPSEIIERRPDIREAERKLASATSHIGVVKGDLFPKFTLTGNIGYSSLTGGSLLDPASLYYTIGPRATFSIFDFGRIRANIETAEISRDQALINYKQAILKAFEDVENALVHYSTEEKRYMTLQEATKSSKATVVLKYGRYASGLVAFGTILDEHIAHLNTYMNTVQSQAALAQNSVTLYKALGGGWQTYTPNVKKD